jgi:hypothetical protein
MVGAEVVKYISGHMTTLGRSHIFTREPGMEEPMVGDTANRLKAGPARSATIHPQKDSFLKWAGWSGVIGTFAFIVTIVMSTGGVSDPDGPSDMARFLSDISDGGASSYVYGIAGVVLVVLYIPWAIGVYRLLGSTTAAWHGSAAVVFDLAVLLPAYLINLLPAASFVPLAEELGGAGSDILYTDYSVAKGAGELFFTVGSVLSLAFGPLLLGASWLRRMHSSRWLGWTAVITGVTGMVWFVWLVDNAVFGSALIVNVLLSLVFFTGASVVLVSRGRTEH